MHNLLKYIKASAERRDRSADGSNVDGRDGDSRFVGALVATGLAGLGAALAAVIVLLLGELMNGLLDAASDNGEQLAAVFVFAATYLVLAIGKLPFYWLDRAGAALLGASLMVGVGALTLDQAYRAIDLNAITLLLGMMIVVANLRLSGVFRLAADWLAAAARRPLSLLAAIAVATGLLSAFLVNDAICLVMPPLVLDILRRLKRDPVPYVLAIPLASNIGSVATITGNPQNMIIGGASGLSYGAFAAALWPVAAAGVVFTVIVVAVAYPGEFFTRAKLPPLDSTRRAWHRGLATKTLLTTLAIVAFFFAGVPVAKVAIIGGAWLLLTRRVKSQKVYREIDWPLLLMFAGLFIVVAGFEAAALTPERVTEVGRIALEKAPMLALVAAALSNLVSNVPAVLVLKPFVATLSDPQRAWLVIAMASTLAGNFTLVGSVANLIVVERARAEGVAIGFWTYFRVGGPLTIATILVGLWVL